MTSTHDRFATLIGTWDTSGSILVGSELEGAEIRGTDRYEWLGERFVVHTADVTLNGQPQRTVEIFTLEESRFEATAYTNDGSIEHVTGTFDDDGTYRAAKTTRLVSACTSSPPR